MQQVNPIYARLFAHSVNESLLALGIQKVKHTHLLAIHEELYQKGLAFPSDSFRKFDQAAEHLHTALVSRGARLGRKNASELADAVLTDREPFLRKPFFVDNADLHNEAVLHGVGVDDEHWCTTQWVPWLRVKADFMVDEIHTMLTAPKSDHPPAVQIDEHAYALMLRQVQAMTQGLTELIELISGTEVGKTELDKLAPLVEKVNDAIALFKRSFYFEPGSTEQDPRKVYLLQQTPFAMQKENTKEALEVITNTQVKITLAGEDSDENFEVFRKS